MSRVCWGTSLAPASVVLGRKCLPSALTLSMILNFCELMRRTQAVCDVMFVPFNRCISTPRDAAMASFCFKAHRAFTLSLSSSLANVAIARTSCVSLEIALASDFLRTACLMSSHYNVIVASGV